MTELLFPQPDREQRAAGVVRGVLSRWLAADGSRVVVGQHLAEIRVADTTGCVAALATGTLWHQAAEGEVLAPGTPVGIID